jgi:hypothetical protein
LAVLMGHAFGQEVAISGVVVDITDGDTCKVLVSGNPLLRIRLNFLRRSEERPSFSTELHADSGVCNNGGAVQDNGSTGVNKQGSIGIAGGNSTLTGVIG